MYKLMVIIFLSWISLSWATNYYVDKNANGNNDGSSWANAWETLEAVVWGSIGANDTLFISGGTDSTVYNMTNYWDINAEGSTSGLAVIRPGLEANHNGRVILDFGGGDYNGVYLNEVEYVRFEKIEVRDVGGNGYSIYVRGTGTGSGRANVVYVDSCTVTEANDRSVMISGYATLANVDSVFIRWNSLTSSVSGTEQTDGIFAMYFSYVEINGNSVYMINEDHSYHNDCIQIQDGTEIVIKNNYFQTGYEGGGVASLRNQGIIVSPAHVGQSIVKVYNNVVNMQWAELYTNVIWMRNMDDSLYFYGNTIIGGASSNVFVQSGTFPDDTYIKNNIFYIDDPATAITIPSNVPAGNIDNNLYYYSTGQTDIVDYGGNKTLAEMRSVGAEINGINDNPAFVDPSSNWMLQDGSPAINAGETLGAPYNTDINGVTRPSGQYTMGAYQYVPRGPDITPPEVTGATLLDSITLKIMFSEVLDETTAEDENNYSISNNINIFNASLSGSEVTLQTSTHSPGSYIVTVVNVEDLAGNPISQSNTAEYSLIPSDSLIFLPIEDVQGVIQEPGHTPLKTIDGLGALSGDPDSRWAAEPMPEELIFDLGTSRTICKTRLSFYNWTGGRFYTYSILTSSDNNNWDTIVSQATSALQEEWTVDEFPAVDARYVKVLFINNNQSDWAGLWEGEIWGIIPSVVEPINNGLPNKFSLDQNYPNPFNPSTKIRFSLPKDQSVKISIYTILGELFTVLIDQKYDAGTYTIDFDGSALTSGIYFYRIETPEFIETKKMILMQ